MRLLVLSPGTAQQQLERMPAIAACAKELGASIQVACSPAYLSLWTLLPSVEKIIPFDFSASLTMADWANLLGSVREPDFQVCLNFAEGRQVNLMLSMSHIPTRVSEAWRLKRFARPQAGRAHICGAIWLRSVSICPKASPGFSGARANGSHREMVLCCCSNPLRRREIGQQNAGSNCRSPSKISFLVCEPFSSETTARFQREQRRLPVQTWC